MLDIDNVVTSAMVNVPLVIALTQLVKNMDVRTHRFAPLFSLLFGLMISFLLSWAGWAEIRHTILNGLIMGLAASGLYSGVKNTVQTDKKDDRMIL